MQAAPEKNHLVRKKQPRFRGAAERGKGGREIQGRRCKVPRPLARPLKSRETWKRVELMCLMASFIAFVHSTHKTKTAKKA
jgi:hypothetical protein